MASKKAVKVKKPIKAKAKPKAKKVQETESKEVGRPSVYKEEYNEQAKKLCLLLNATDKDLAEFFDVCEKTINNWKIEHPEFLQSIRAGKTVADAEVAHSLYERATGAKWIEEAAFKVKKVVFENGKKVSESEEVVTVPLKKAAPPDTQAGALWLHNRRPDQWRKAQDQTKPPTEIPVGEEYNLTPDEGIPDAPIL